MNPRYLGKPRPMFDDYLASEQLSADLEQAAKVWTRENVFRHSAIYIYVNQVCMPELMEIELKHSRRLVDCELFARDLERTRLFLRRVVGLEDEGGWGGGISNPRVQKQLMGVGKQHRAFGLSPWMNTYLGYIIAASALYVRPECPVPEDVAQDYMSYMNLAWKCMDVPDQELDAAIDIGEQRAGEWQGIDACLQVILKTYFALFGKEESVAIWDHVTQIAHPTVSELMTRTRSKL